MLPKLRQISLGETSGGERGERPCSDIGAGRFSARFQPDVGGHGRA